MRFPNRTPESTDAIQARQLARVPYLKRAPVSSTIRRGPVMADNFTIINNSHIRDAALTWEARGLLGWLTSHADGFKVTEDTITEAGPAGRRAVRSMLQELERAGHLRRERTPIVTGGSTVDYVLTDPRECRNSTLPRVPQQHPRADQAKDLPAEGEPAGQAPDAPRVPQEHSRSLLEDQKKTKTPSVSRRTAPTTTGTRLPEDFIPTPEMREWFAEEKLHLAIDARIEHEKFVNYWVGCPGAKGRKLDWARTWKNWMWTAAERAGKRPGNALVPVSGAPYRPSTTDQKVAQTLELGRRLQQQMEESA